MDEYVILCPWQYVFTFMDHHSLCNSSLVCKQWMAISLSQWKYRSTGFVDIDYLSTTPMFPKKYFKMALIKNNWKNKVFIASAYTITKSPQLSIPARLYPLFTSIPLPIYCDAFVEVRYDHNNSVVVRDITNDSERIVYFDFKPDWRRLQYDPVLGWLAAPPFQSENLRIIDLRTEKEIRSYDDSPVFYMDGRLDLIAHAKSSHRRTITTISLSKLSTGELVKETQMDTGQWHATHIAFNGQVIIVSLHYNFYRIPYVLAIMDLQSLDILYHIRIDRAVEELQMSDSAVVVGTSSKVYVIDFDCEPDYNLDEDTSSDDKAADDEVDDSRLPEEESTKSVKVDQLAGQVSILSLDNSKREEEGDSLEYQWPDDKQLPEEGYDVWGRMPGHEVMLLHTSNPLEWRSQFNKPFSN